MELNKNTIDELKKIEIQYLKIRELILLIQSFNYEKIIEFLKEEEQEIIKKYKYDNNKYQDLLKKL